MQSDLSSLLVIVAISALVPLIVGLTRIKVSEVVLLLGGGIIFGPNVLDLIHTDAAIDLLAEMGLGLLFFLAGNELERNAISGKNGKLAAIGWGASLLMAGLVTGGLSAIGFIQDYLGIAIALTTTALGTLLPVLRDAGESNTRFGLFFMGAGAWGELGPIITIAILFGAKSSFVAILSLTGFAIVALIVALLPQRLNNPRVRAVLQRGYGTSSQTAVRITMLLLVFLLTIASDFGLDAILGAFIAGIIVRRYAPRSEESMLHGRIEGIAFGFFIPIFFIISGANLDIVSIIQNPLTLIVFFALLLLVRGLPQFFIYRKAIPDAFQRGRFSLLVATGLPMIVAITTLEVETGAMLPRNAAGLVGAGALSVLVFPLVASALGKKVRNPLPEEELAH
ncbi:sodium/hydrogen exchanger [Actinomycetes bacterium]|nr:sodium/hydrogen exchanger [Actinomycetes bacterium]